MLNVKDFGAAGNGIADDTRAIQRALNACTPNECVFFPGGTYIISNTLNIPSDYVHVLGPATIKARGGSNFHTLLLGTDRTGCTVRYIEFDANKAGRIADQGRNPLNGAGFNHSTECVFEHCVARNTRGVRNGMSAVGLFMAALSKRCRLDSCLLVDCGDSGADSDGIFTSGDQNVIANCIARNCTDAAFVLEKSNYSVISGCTAEDCSAIAGITNDHEEDKRGNIINGLTGRTRFNGQTGQIQIGCPGTPRGNLLETVVSNVTLFCPEGTAGSGPAIAVRQQGHGRAIGVTISNCRIDGATTHGIVADGDGVEILNCHIQRTVDHCITFLNGTTGGRVANCVLKGGSYGITARGNAEAITQNNIITDSVNHGIFAGGTSILASHFNVIKSSGVAHTGKTPEATLDFLGVEANQLGIGNVHGAAPAGNLIDKFVVTNDQGKPVGYVGIYDT